MTENTDTTITPKMTTNAKAEMSFVITASVTNEIQARLPAGIENLTVKQVLKLVRDKLKDSRDGKQEELSATTKNTKLGPGRTITDYVIKHRILRKDMLKAGFPEIVAETEN